MKQTEYIEYLLFGLTITLFQFAGYSVLTMPLLAFSALLMFSPEKINLQIKVNPIFTFFLVGSIPSCIRSLCGGSSTSLPSCSRV